MAKKSKTEQVGSAIAMLEDDHKTVELLFEEFDSLAGNDDADQAVAVANDICARLTIHARMEEEIFYPAANNEETSDLLQESIVEHSGVKFLISEILAWDGDVGRLRAMVSVLRSQVEHHVEEEESTLFPEAVNALDDNELMELGSQMQALRSRLQNGREQKPTVPPPTLRKRSASRQDGRSNSKES